MTYNKAPSKLLCGNLLGALYSMNKVVSFGIMLAIT